VARFSKDWNRGKVLFQELENLENIVPRLGNFP
jgi:hypothetical protein